MRIPRLPQLPLDPGDRVAVVGLVAVTAGTWARWNWPLAALVFGGLLLLAYAVSELRGGAS